MSADNWAVCPKCLERAQNKRNDAIKNLEKQYGKIDSKEWMKMQENIPPHPNTNNFRVFREDYQIGITETGVFEVGYSGKCDDCGHKFVFHYAEKTK